MALENQHYGQGFDIYDYTSVERALRRRGDAVDELEKRIKHGYRPQDEVKLGEEYDTVEIFVEDLVDEQKLFDSEGLDEEVEDVFAEIASFKQKIAANLISAEKSFSWGDIEGGGPAEYLKYLEEQKFIDYNGETPRDLALRDRIRKALMDILN